MTGEGSSPEDRGVLVLGMHRSGTSVAARLVSLLGPSLCRPEDLLRGHDGNVRGHWECAPLVTLNDRMLQHVASRWWCPPADGQIAALATDQERRAGALAAVRRSHPRSPWVWKDPRNSLTLPFWRQALPTPPAVVCVLRHPDDVVASLHARDGIGPEFGEALWERYLHLTAAAVEGLPLWVSTYDALVTDPFGWAERAAEFLSSHGVTARRPSDPQGVRGYVERTSRSRQPEAHVSAARLALWDAASNCGLGELPEPEPGTAELMDEVREAFGLQAVEARPAGGTFVSRSGIRVLRYRARPPAVSRRRVSVVLMPGAAAASLEQGSQVRRRLPADAEVVTVLPPGESPAADDPDWFVAVRTEQPTSLANRLDLAAERGQGDLLVVLAGPPVAPLPGWLPALRAALAYPDCAVAVPGLVPAGGGAPAFGVTVSRLLTETAWVETTPGARTPFPVTAGTVAAMATTRRAWEAAGGFDHGMRAVGSEDLDYCLRLWRSGWRCLAVPAARLQIRLTALPADPVDVLTDTLRLGFVHLPADTLEEQLAELRDVPGFATALARVTASDAGRRRVVVSARSWYALDELAAAGLDPLLAGPLTGKMPEEA